MEQKSINGYQPQDAVNGALGVPVRATATASWETAGLDAPLHCRALFYGGGGGGSLVRSVRRAENRRKSEGGETESRLRPFALPFRAPWRPAGSRQRPPEPAFAFAFRSRALSRREDGEAEGRRRRAAERVEKSRRPRTGGSQTPGAERRGRKESPCPPREQIAGWALQPQSCCAVYWTPHPVGHPPCEILLESPRERTPRSMAMEEFQVAIHQGKLSDAISVVLAKPLQYFSDTPLNVAVVGEPGSGKSSFVNSMLGKRSGEPGAAETGIQTTTTKAKDYPLPTFRQVILWDLPGREESYGSRIDQMDLNRFDFFIIVGYQRFRTVHADLVHEIQAMGKRLYFVRAKTDLDLEASRRRQPTGYDDQKVLQRIKEDCVTCLLSENVIDPQVFLVSNWDPQSLDFPLLMQKLQSDLLWLKRQAFIFSLPSLSAPVLENKKAAMKGKIWVKVLFCGFLGLLPVPGISFVVAMFFFVKFRSQCYRVFGLDYLSLTALARDVGKPVAALQAVMTSKPLMPIILWRLPDLVGTILMLVEYCLWERFPFAGCLVSGGSSFLTSYYMLHRCLAAVAKDTQNVLSRALEGREKTPI